MKIDPWHVAEDPVADEAVRFLLRAEEPRCLPDGALPGEAEALAAFRAAGHDHGRPLMQTTRTRARVLIATAATTGMVMCGGAAAAATGTLPGAAQQTARDMLASVGITVPGPSSHASGHADGRGESHPTDATTPGDTTTEDGTTEDGTTEDSTPDVTTPEDEPSAQPSSQGKGAEISQLARTTTATGVDKGAEISTLASGGKSQAGQHGAQSEAGTPGTAHRPSEPGAQGRGHRPSEPGSQSTAHRPSAPGSKAGSKAGSSHRH